VPRFQQGYLTTKSGAWIGHYSRWIIDPKTGEKVRRQHAFRIGALNELTKTQARDKLRERMVEDLRISGDGRITLAWFIENRWKPLREGRWRASTKQTNEELLKIITERFGVTALEDVDPVELQTWLYAIAKERSGSAVKHIRIFLMSVLKEATEQDYLRKNPARLLRVPSVRRVDKTFLSLAQVKALLKAALWDPRERALLTFLLVVPLRPSELFALRWRDFEMKKATITLRETIYRGVLRPYTKTTREGEAERITMHVPGQAAFALNNWYGETKHKDEDDFIFPAAEGGFWHKENYQRRVLIPLAELAGIERVNFQILRRTVATWAQDLGTPQDIQAILRHKKAATAQEHYVQIISESVKATSEKLAARMLK
jgi:integrase